MECLNYLLFYIVILMKKKKIQLVPIIQGGQQEQGLRGGTENAPANIVLAKTIRLALEEQSKSYAHVLKINQYLREELAKINGAHVHSPKDAIPYILNISFDQITSEVLLNALDQRGFVYPQKVLVLLRTQMLLKYCWLCINQSLMRHMEFVYLFLMRIL